MHNDPDNAKMLKDNYKEKLTPEIAKTRAEWVKSCQEPLVLIDIGGKISEENKIICEAATHIILLAGDLKDLKEWREFSQSLNLQIIAEIHSDRDGKADKELEYCEEGFYRGSIHYLKRGDKSVQERPTVKKLAELLIHMTATTFNIDMETDGKLKIGFSKGKPAQNDQLVKDAEKRLEFLIENQAITGGDIIKINGPATNPVSMVLAHKLSHIYQAVAYYDPKISKYVVAVAHGDVYSVGDLIE